MKEINLDALKKALKDYQTTMFGSIGDAFLAEMELVKEDSMANCPVAPDGGTLRASHEVIGPTREGKKLSITIEVGGAAESYALAVHEHLSDHSPPSWLKAEADGRPVQFNVGGPKFLENAYRRAMPGMAERVKARVS
jgi:hypothetical protein